MENICRTCTRISDNLKSLFEEEFQLPHKISVVSGIEVVLGDSLPSTICVECIQNINLFYNFRTVVRNSDLDLKERLATLKNIHEPTADVDLTEYKVQPQQQYSSVQFAEKKRNISYYNLKNLVTYKRKIYSCKDCSFTCKERLLLSNHKRAKHDERKVCNICGKSFRADNLNKHINSHLDLPVNCSVCGKTFKNSESLRSHSFIHRGIEFVCEVCGKVYSYRGEYNRHLATHDPNRQKKVKCPMCDKMFFNKKTIKKHMQSHTGLRPHICQHCQKGFSSTYALKTHIRLHTNERPYICEFCPSSFPQKVSLMNHRKLKHDIIE